MKTVVITGSEGKSGRYVVKEFAEHGYRVIGSDLRAANSPGDYDQFRQWKKDDFWYYTGVIFFNLYGL